ncbi:MAG: hypothetical protein ISS45_05545 [Candidatus Omnitrophica bacterium]|nr:hypothetical protein [Candidatus Omnitrophota bacterium]
MSVLKDILKESKEHYIEAKRKIEKKLLSFPQGSVKERVISGRKYYYLQYRKGEKVIQKYLGKVKPEKLIKQLKEKRLLKVELRKVNEALRVLKRSEGRKHD